MSPSLLARSPVSGRLTHEEPLDAVQRFGQSEHLGGGNLPDDLLGRAVDDLDDELSRVGVDAELEVAVDRFDEVANALRGHFELPAIDRRFGRCRLRRFG